MKKLFRLLATALFITGSSISCGEDQVVKPQSNSINKILPLGASRVEGFRPHFESYRYELWKDLKAGGWTFDYIGTRSDPSNYPVFNGQAFDVDHEGRGGYTSGEILDGLPEWLSQTGAPDIVLFSSPGGNDMLNGLSSFDQTVSNINEIIDLLQESNTAVTIIIEELAPGTTSFMTPEFTADFNTMQQVVREIASQQSTTTSQVLTVDMFTGFTDAMLADEVHYNEAGAIFIADRYLDVLITVLEE